MECRGGEGERFGQGQEKTMNFGAFLEQLERKSVLYYLTTQVGVGLISFFLTSEGVIIYCEGGREEGRKEINEDIK